MPFNTTTDARVTSSALPSGAATAARQDTGNATIAQVSGQLPTALDANGRLKAGQGSGYWTTISYVTLVGAGTLTTGIIDLSDYDRVLVLIKNGQTVNTISPIFTYEDPVVGTVTGGTSGAIGVGNTVILAPNMVGLTSTTFFQNLSFQYYKLSVALTVANAGSYFKVIGWRRQ